MNRSRACLILIGLAFRWFTAMPSFAGGLIPDRANKVLIEGQFSDPQQEFLLIFSAKPLCGERDRPVTSLSERELQSFESGHDQLLIRVYGKNMSKPGQF